MAFNYSPKIVTNGLVLYLDAANPKSYISGSTAWNDLSTSGNRGVLTNGPTFSSANAGSIVFDGTNDYALLPDIGVTELTQFSVGCWVRTSTGAIFPAVYSEGNPPDWANNLFILYYGDSSISGGVRVWFAGNDRLRYNVDMRDGIWRYVVYTQTTTSNRTLYVNGISVATNTVTISQNSTTSIIGAANSFGSLTQFYSGNISNLQLYNRFLSASEILQNYNAMKPRFGL